MPKTLTETALRLLRKPYIPAALLIAAAGCFFLPMPWRSVLLSLCLAPLCLCALCLGRRQDDLHWHQAAPDAGTLLALQQVDADALLLTGGAREVRSAAHPFGLDDALRLTSGSSMLLLATAAILTADQLDSPSREAVVQRLSPMGFTPAALQKRCPALGVTALDGLPGIACRDGLGRRAYFAAAPEELLPRCTQVWDGTPRPLNEDDRRRILDDAALMVAGGCMPMAYATLNLRPDAPEEAVYLGMLGVGDALPAPDFTAPLRRLGVTVRPVGEEHAVSLAWLQRQLHAEYLPDAPVLVTASPREGSAPQLLVRQDESWPESLANRLTQLRYREASLHQLSLLMILLTLLSAAAAPASWAVPVLALMALCGVRHAEPAQPRSLARAAAITVPGTAATAWFLQRIGTPALPELSALLLAVVMAFLTAPCALQHAWPIWLASVLLCAAAMLIGGTAALPAAFALAAGLLLGILGRLLMLRGGRKR